MKIVEFTTENGTRFRLVHNRHLMTWERLSSTPRSGVTRSNSGTLLEWPKLAVGYSAYLNDSDVRPGCDHHYVITSHVVLIEEKL